MKWVQLDEFKRFTTERNCAAREFLASSEAQTSSEGGDIEDDKLVRETDLHETGKWIRKLIPEIRWCISEWAIYDF